jgi:hypothetical protein
MDGADGQGVTFLGTGSNILDGLLGCYTASGVDDSLMQRKINDPANGVVGIRGRAALANNLPQSCSKVRIVKSSNKQFGSNELKDVQFFEQMGPIPGERHSKGCRPQGLRRFSPSQRQAEAVRGGE